LLRAIDNSQGAAISVGRMASTRALLQASRLGRRRGNRGGQYGPASSPLLRASRLGRRRGNPVLQDDVCSRRISAPARGAPHIPRPAVRRSAFMLGARPPRLDYRQSLAEGAAARIPATTVKAKALPAALPAGRR